MKLLSSTTLLGSAAILLSDHLVSANIFRAVCKINIDDASLSTAGDEAKGHTNFVQRMRSSGRFSPTFISTNWDKIVPNQMHTLAILGSDVDDCQSEEVVTMLLEEEGLLSTEFGTGGMRFKTNEVSLAGDDSIVGKWL